MNQRRKQTVYKGVIFSSIIHGNEIKNDKDRCMYLHWMQSGGYAAMSFYGGDSFTVN